MYHRVGVSRPEKCNMIIKNKGPFCLSQAAGLFVCLHEITQDYTYIIILLDCFICSGYYSLLR